MQPSIPYLSGFVILIGGLAMQFAVFGAISCSLYDARMLLQSVDEFWGLNSIVIEISYFWRL